MSMSVTDVYGGVFLGWYDPDARKSVEEKIREGCERYFAKYGEPAKTVLVSEGLDIEIDGLEILHEGFIRPDHFWVGLDASQRDRAGKRGEQVGSCEG
jgi:hypothetical protein